MPVPTITRDAPADATAILDVLGTPAGSPPPIAALLQASRGFHEQYLRWSHHWTPIPGQPNPGADPQQARLQFNQAAQLRAYAQQLDPTHTDPAWAQEVGSSYESDNLLFFYRRIVVDGAPFGGFR